MVGVVEVAEVVMESSAPLRVVDVALTGVGRVGAATAVVVALAGRSVAGAVVAGFCGAVLVAGAVLVWEVGRTSVVTGLSVVLARVASPVMFLVAVGGGPVRWLGLRLLWRGGAPFPFLAQ